MYTELLEETISELKGMAKEDRIDPDLRLGVSAFLPESYLSDPNQRLVIYRRLASAESDQAVYELSDELCDRYGDLPQAGLLLIEVMQLRVLLKRLRIEAVEYDGRHLVFAFHASTPIKPETILARLQQPGTPCSFTPDYRLSIDVGKLDDKQLLLHAKKNCKRFCKYASLNSFPISQKSLKLRCKRVESMVHAPHRYILLFGLLLTLLTACTPQEETSSPVLLRVDGREVTLEQFRKEFSQAQPPEQKLSEEERKEMERAFLAQLIDRELALAEADRLGIVITPKSSKSRFPKRAVSTQKERLKPHLLSATPPSKSGVKGYRATCLWKNHRPDRLLQGRSQ